jgi:hypothetical protein
MISKPVPGQTEPAQNKDKSTSVSNGEVHRRLDEGDSDKIDAVLEELGVTKTAVGARETEKPDTEGSNSSSKNLDEEGK